jgi:general secretion pathway protein L
MRSVGIDIGSSGVKVVDLEVTTKSVRLIECFEVAVNADPAIDRRVPTLEILLEISSRYDPATTRFTFAVPQQNVSIRHKVFPFRERNKILQSLPFELEDDVPLTIESAVFEAKALRYQGHSTEVLALICPKSNVIDLINHCHDANLDPDVISCEAAALSTLGEDWAAPVQRVTNAEFVTENATSTEINMHPEPAKLVLHMGHERTVLCAFHMGALISTRTFYFGGLAIIKMIMKQYGIPFADAHKGLTEKGFILTNTEGATGDQVTFSNTITSSFKEFNEDLKRSILEIQGDFKVQISNLDLSGGVSQLVNLCPYLTQILEIPCNVLKPLETFNRSDISDSVGTRCAVALGLALEGAKRPANPAVNFRKGELGKENSTFRLFFEKWNYALKLCAIAVACFYLFSFLREPFSSAINEASVALLRSKAQEAGLKKGQAGIAQVRKFIREREQEVKKRKTLSELQDVNSALYIMDRLSQLVPQKDQIQLDVRRFYLLNDTLTLEGQVSNRESLPSLMQSLQSLSVNRQVTELAPSASPQAGRVAFAYSLKVARRGQK